MSASSGNAEIGTTKVAGPVEFRVSTTNRFHTLILNCFMDTVLSIMSQPLISSRAATRFASAMEHSLELSEPSLNYL